jgi:YqaJ-like recombinase protein
VIDIRTDIEQGTPEWYLARCGVPTASEFKKVKAKGEDGSDSKTRADYLWQLVDEALYGKPIIDTYQNEYMLNGKAKEAEARSIYALERDIEPEIVGFIKNQSIHAGYSPDSLLGKDGTLEIKVMLPKLWSMYWVKGGYPVQFKPQIQGGLLVSGRAFCDLMIYWPERKPYIIRIERDEPYITGLSLALKLFNAELKNNVDAIRTSWDLRGQLETSAQ